MSLSLKEIIQIARAQFKELLPELAISSSQTDWAGGENVGAILKSMPNLDPVRLEEIERQGDNWAITFSVPNPSFDESSLLEGIRSARNLARIAKVIVVDGTDGNLVALRERAA